MDVGNDLDVGRLRELFGDDQAELEAFLSLAIANARELVAKLARAVRGKEEEALDLAHDLKGSCANFGATHLAKTAAQIETRVKTGDWDSANAYMASVEGALNDLETSIGK